MDYAHALKQQTGRLKQKKVLKDKSFKIKKFFFKVFGRVKQKAAFIANPMRQYIIMTPAIIQNVSKSI